MLKPILASLLAFAAFAADEAPKASTIAIDKAIDAQLAPASKAYDAYQKALQDATSKVVASLEKLKADYNDTKKFAGMSIADRAAAIAEIDKKIGEIKKGALGEKVVAGRGGDLLGESNDSDIAKMIIGKWQWNSPGEIVEIKIDNTASFNADSGKVTIKNGIMTIKWKSNFTDVVDFRKMNDDGTYNRKLSTGQDFKVKKLP